MRLVLKVVLSCPLFCVGMLFANDARAEKSGPASYCVVQSAGRIVGTVTSNKLTNNCDHRVCFDVDVIHRQSGRVGFVALQNSPITSIPVIGPGEVKLRAGSTGEFWIGHFAGGGTYEVRYMRIHKC